MNIVVYVVVVVVVVDVLLCVVVTAPSDERMLRFSVDWAPVRRRSASSPR